MNKKDSSTKKHKRKEDTVENIYGVHFKYQDLFSRLLEVQKQRRHSEAKSPVVRLQSFDSMSLKRNNSTRVKNTGLKGKKSDTSLKIKIRSKSRSTSAKKNITKILHTDRKTEIFKSFSPSHKVKKSTTHLKSSSKKKLEKKAVSQSRNLKKQALKPKNA